MIRLRKKCYLFLKNSAGEQQIAAIKTAHFPDPHEYGPSSTKPHGHDFYELTIVLRGKGIHLFKQQKMEIHTGSVLLIAPNEVHSYLFEEPLILLNFMFKAPVLRPIRHQLQQFSCYNALFKAKAVKPQFFVDHATITELDVSLNTIAVENQQKGIGSDLILQSEMTKVLVSVLRIIQDSPTAVSPNVNMLSVISYMTSHYQEEISISDLARQGYQSESSLYRKFKKEFNTSPIDWLLHFRIHKAQEFLVRSEMSIANVASATGFKDQLYFARQFRKVTGCTPKQYRNDNHGRVRSICGEFIQDQWQA